MQPSETRVTGITFPVAFRRHCEPAPPCRTGPKARSAWTEAARAATRNRRGYQLRLARRVTSAAPIIAIAIMPDSGASGTGEAIVEPEVVSVPVYDAVPKPSEA